VGGRQGVNTRISVLPRESCACSDRLKPCSRSGARHKEQTSASSTVYPEFVHTVDGLMGMGFIVR